MCRTLCDYKLQWLISVFRNTLLRTYKHQDPHLIHLGSPSRDHSANLWRCTSLHPYTQTALGCSSWGLKRQKDVMKLINYTKIVSLIFSPEILLGVNSHFPWYGLGRVLTFGQSSRKRINVKTVFFFCKIVAYTYSGPVSWGASCNAPWLEGIKNVQFRFLWWEIPPTLPTVRWHTKQINSRPSQKSTRAFKQNTLTKPSTDFHWVITLFPNTVLRKEKLV